jgi:hypothetical protein
LQVQDRPPRNRPVKSAPTTTVRNRRQVRVQCAPTRREQQLGNHQEGPSGVAKREERGRKIRSQESQWTFPTEGGHQEREASNSSLQCSRCIVLGLLRRLWGRHSLCRWVAQVRVCWETNQEEGRGGEAGQGKEWRQAVENQIARRPLVPKSARLRLEESGRVGRRDPLGA